MPDESRAFARLEDKVILVTGASRGIGAAASRKFARLGAKIILADIQDGAGEQNAAAIRQEGGEALYVHADVSHEQEVADLVESAVRAWGRLDGAFNNAGIVNQGQLHATERADHERVLRVNLDGVFWCLKHEIAAMQETGGGAIVNNASVAGLVGVPNHSTYTATKHAVIGLTKAAALEQAGNGIRINIVCPGAVETEIWKTLPDGVAIRAALIEATPLQRIADPSEIAGPVAFLLSDAASYITGATLAIDGAFTAC